jgi:hypothetical protein
MSDRAVKSGIEVLDDLSSFFETSVEFIAMPVEKLRRTQGKDFSMKVVKDLVELRNENKQDRK